MKLKAVGKNTLAVEVTNVSAHGIWLIVNEREFFLSYNDFPWFKEAKINDILDVRLLHSGHLHWPLLDIDLELASLENKENYPLIFK
jgi:hypothetical protein